jgi:hypothetical protein
MWPAFGRFYTGHGPLYKLNLFSLCSQILDDLVQTVLVDGAETFGGHLQGDPLVFLSQEKPLGLQIGQEPAVRLDIRVRHFVAGDRNFTRDLTYSSHDAKIWTAKVVKY